jgi:hypothetical protein
VTSKSADLFSFVLLGSCSACYWILSTIICKNKDKKLQKEGNLRSSNIMEDSTRERSLDHKDFHHSQSVARTQGWRAPENFEIENVATNDSGKGKRMFPIHEKTWEHLLMKIYTCY